jgi:ribonuclease HI
MIKSKKKYYVVWNGRRNGIFGTWAECLRSINGFPGARYKSFNCKERAEAEYCGRLLLPPEAVGALSIAVDGACSGSTGEFRGVMLPCKVEIFRQGPFEGATNNLMEYIAIIEGLRWMERRGIRCLLYSDSNVAISWANDDDHRVVARDDGDASKRVDSDIRWLGSCVDKKGLLSCIRKWDTSRYGEILADFNRK